MVNRCEKLGSPDPDKKRNSTGPGEHNNQQTKHQNQNNDGIKEEEKFSSTFGYEGVWVCGCVFSVWVVLLNADGKLRENFSVLLYCFLFFVFCLLQNT